MVHGDVEEKLAALQTELGKVGRTKRNLEKQAAGIETQVENMQKPNPALVQKLASLRAEIAQLDEAWWAIIDKAVVGKLISKYSMG